MLELLEKHLSNTPTKCITAQWISTLSDEEQKAFEKIKENNKKISIAKLFTDLESTMELDFKLTAFRSHFRGYCTCQK